MIIKENINFEAAGEEAARVSVNFTLSLRLARPRSRLAHGAIQFGLFAGLGACSPGKVSASITPMLVLGSLRRIGLGCQRSGSDSPR